MYWLKKLRKRKRKGNNRDENNKLCGDVDFESVKEVTSIITPIPGGVSPLTVANLLKNTLQLHINNTKGKSKLGRE